MAITLDGTTGITTPGLSNTGAEAVTGNLTVNGNTTLGDASTDTILMTGAPSIGGAGYGMGMGFRNRIINGAMVIDQRNAGASITPSGTSQFSVDRWINFTTQSGKYSTQQRSTDSSASNYEANSAPAGFVNSIKVTSLSAYSIGSGDEFNILQQIEGYNIADLAWGTASASTVTFSFWVKSSLTGTFGGALQNNAQTRSYPFSFTINSANTWEQKSITITGETSGVWVVNNGIGIKVAFGLGVGSTYSATAGAWATGNYWSSTGATSVVGTNGATFYITGVQLEKGSTATSFDYRPYGTELQLCQRYCIKYINGYSGTYVYYPVACANDATTSSVGSMGFPVPIRSPAVLSLTTTGTAANYSLYSAGSIRALTVVPTLGSVNNDGLGCQLSLTVASGLVSGNSSNLLGTNSASPYLLFQSEL